MLKTNVFAFFPYSSSSSSSLVIVVVVAVVVVVVVSASRRSIFVFTIYYLLFIYCKTFIFDAEQIQEVRKSIMKDHCLTHKFDQNPSAKGESFAYIFVDDKFQLI